MKLYALFNEVDNKIIALSENKQFVYRYLLQNNYNQNYKVTKIKKQDLIDKFLIIYDELILDEVEGLILTTYERRLINTTVKQEVSHVEDVIESLHKFLVEYNFKDKDKTIIKKSIKVLERNIKPKKVNNLLKIKDFILDMFLPSYKDIVNSFREEINLRDNKYYIFINIDDD